MIYFFYGDNITKRQNACESVISDLAKKSPTSVSIISDTDATTGMIEEFANSVSLFGDKQIVVLERVFENVEVKDFIFKNLELLKDSNTVFIFSEKSALKDTVTKFKKFGKDVEAFELPKKVAGKKDWNAFALADAVGARDKKLAWVNLTKAFRADKSPEEIHGMLFWQIKNMLLVKTTERASATTLGINPFVFRKMEMSAKKFTAEELKNISSSLVPLLYKSRAENSDSQIALERFILQAF